MRLDKFLKVSRIIKRRPIAKIVVDGGKAKLNGNVAKEKTSDLIKVLESRGIEIDIDSEEDIF